MIVTDGEDLAEGVGGNFPRQSFKVIRYLDQIFGLDFSQNDVHCVGGNCSIFFKHPELDNHFQRYDTVTRGTGSKNAKVILKELRLFPLRSVASGSREIGRLLRSKQKE